MATIGTMAAKLVADSGPFIQGMAKAKAAVLGLGKAVKALQSMAHILQGAVVAVAGMALVGWISNSMDAIIATVRLTRELGATTQGFTALRHGIRSLGGEASSLEGGLRALNETFSQLEHGSASVQDLFQRLGLDGQELARLPIDQAFVRIAQRLSEIRDPTQRAAAAVQLFGQDAVGLLPLLSQGEAGFQRFADEARRLGLSFDEVDATNVESARLTLDRVGQLLEGVITQVAIALAPWIQAAADEFANLGDSGLSVGGVIVDVLQAVAKGIAFIIDTVNRARGMFELLRVGLFQILQTATTTIANLLDIAGRLPDELGGRSFREARDSLRGWSTEFRNQMQQANLNARELFNTDAMGAVNGFFERIRVRAQEAGRDVNNLRNAMGAVPAAARHMRAFQDGLRVFQEHQSPLQTFEETMRRITQLLQEGAIGQDTFARATARAVNELERAHQLSDLQSPTALRRESAEARSAVVRAERDIRTRETPQARVERILEQARLIEQQQLEIQRQIARELQQQNRQPRPQEAQIQ